MTVNLGSFFAPFSAGFSYFAEAPLTCRAVQRRRFSASSKGHTPSTVQNRTLKIIATYKLLRSSLALKDLDQPHFRGLLIRELLLVIAWNAIEGHPMTINQCILDVSGSEKTVRKNLQLLLRLGYIIQKSGDRDRRERVLLPSPDFLEKLSHLDDMLSVGNPKPQAISTDPD